VWPIAYHLVGLIQDLNVTILAKGKTISITAHTANRIG
jgi:hypothetical protein